MIGNIIRWSTRNTFLVLLATAFITLAGIYAVWHTALDAIPDLSDTQVIVYTEYSGQAPQVIEDQITYPLTTALLAVPRSMSRPFWLSPTLRFSIPAPSKPCLSIGAKGGSSRVR